MKKKLWLPIALGLILILGVTSLVGCSGTPTTIEGVNFSQQVEGIWVNGTGEVMAKPDIVTLNLGVVAQETTVADAMNKASAAMDKVMQALKDAGIAEKDIQTGSFSISQRTRWNDTTQTNVVIGYNVTNMVTVKIRNVDKAGTIIDAVAKAGGDLTRINSINFTVEDPTAYYDQAREKAMADAKKKAEQIAGLAGLKLGKPTYITESSQNIVPTRDYAYAMAAPVPEMAVTSISPGENKITLNVQVAYALIP